MYRCLYECGSGQYSGYIRENEGEIDWTDSEMATTEPASSDGISNALDSRDPVSRVEVDRSEFVSDYASGRYKGQPIQLAAGKAAHAPIQVEADQAVPRRHQPIQRISQPNLRLHSGSRHEVWAKRACCGKIHSV